MSSEVGLANQPYDALIIGGGFYGSVIATYLVKHRGLKKIILVERESGLLTRASYHNQARVHNGYHYPRSLTTAYRSRINSPRFIQDWSSAMKKDFVKLYAISRNNSKVTAKQFYRFCKNIGAKIERAPPSLRNFFSPYLIEDIFLVEEYAFDAVELASLAAYELSQMQIHLLLNTEVKEITQENGQIFVLTVNQKQEKKVIACQRVFNCAYSGMNQFTGDYPSLNLKLKHEIIEIALVEVPAELRDLGITVMDGPFFSLMPFPARDLHSLSHVRYSPHNFWLDQPGCDPYLKLAQYHKITRADRMIRDLGRYMPKISSKLNYIDSFFEIKTVLLKSEVDDSRPIAFQKHEKLSNFYSVLGGKIDNIYDILEKLDKEFF